ncbi:MAG: hypothetical protein M1814_000318 [Vezdaea aestivalis]|nr:MAG: hypothetical protein M1814_000318 [Vezdaea aestivalis]
MDRHLATLLHSLQTVDVQQDTARLFPTAASILASLSNPLNVTLLSTQLLTAPAIWHRPDGLTTSLGILTIFHSASLALADKETARLGQPVQQRNGARAVEPWLKAVVKGADDRSPRWKHLLALGGMLVGFEGQGKGTLTSGLRADLEGAVVKALNLALEEARNGAGDAATVVLVASHVFDVLPEWRKREIDFDSLLPLLLKTVFFSSLGLQSGYFLGAIDSDITQAGSSQFTWSPKSAAAFQVQKLTTSPILSSLGTLARLAAYGSQRARSNVVVYQIIEHLLAFTDVLCAQWKSNKLSEIDMSEERQHLHPEALQTTLPTLWNLLKLTLLTTLLISQGAIDRLLNDRSLSANGGAIKLASGVLSILRNLYFITIRFGTHAFSVQTFLHLTCIDILSSSTAETISFLQSIAPPISSSIPSHPHDRTLTLFYLNTAEHFAPLLPSDVCSSLLVSPATPYLGLGAPSLVELFEAAHSVMLAVLSSPFNATLAVSLLPDYAESLFRVFPSGISDRQFRIAFKTLVRVSSPPAPLANAMPDMPYLLLEMIRHRASTADPAPLADLRIIHAEDEGSPGPRLSEQAYLVLALLDSLPFLATFALEEWLGHSAELVTAIPDPVMQKACQDRFWQVLSSGEMDVERSQVGVAWWGSRGGRSAVLAI